ncbi:MAG: hypothetical protein DMG27_02835, partial [Acidobacteria bacterium]
MQGGITYSGYGWFRRWFELPDDARGEDLVFVLGGYDHQDWNEYRIYVNGAEIGRRVSSGRWRTPGQFVLAPGSPVYAALRFGSGEKNLLAVRTRGYNKHFGGLSEEVLKHYVFEPVLVDQFISVRKPYLRLSDFEVNGLQQVHDDKVIFELRSPSQPVSVSLHYELDGPTRRKWVEVTNRSANDLLLLDVQLDNFGLHVPISEGGPGEPIFIGGEAFCSIEHPAGINQGDRGRVRTMHFPGRTLHANSSTQSFISLVSMAQTGQALEHFVSYIQERSPRKRKAISIYDPFGINNQWGGCPTLSDVEMLDGLEVLNKWRQKGFCFDYYVPDWGWTDHTPDLKKFASTCFPHGPDEVVKRVEALGMKFGLWFAVSNLATSDGTYPAGLQSSMVLSSRSERETIGPAVGAYRNGYPVAFGMGPQLCVASEPYFSL